MDSSSPKTKDSNLRANQLMRPSVDRRGGTGPPRSQRGVVRDFRGGLRGCHKEILLVESSAIWFGVSRKTLLSTCVETYDLHLVGIILWSLSRPGSKPLWPVLWCKNGRWTGGPNGIVEEEEKNLLRPSPRTKSNRQTPAPPKGCFLVAFM